MEFFNKNINNKSLIEKAKNILAKDGIVDLTSFFDNKFIGKFAADTLAVFEEKQQRKDFLMSHTANTPRNMFTVSEKTIDVTSALIPQFYENIKITEFLTKIASENVILLPWKGERYLINGLTHTQDTHGWHCDDYSYALVFIAKAPKPEEGGHVESIPYVTWNSKNSSLEEIFQKRKPAKKFFKDGSFYLMRSDTTLHRVAPLIKDSLRVAIAMSFCNERDYQKDIDHETIYALYGV